MSRHDGVSCDVCLKGNFHGRRYKCLVCYDYDLCASCHEAGVGTTRHTADHPMQCILTRTEFELYFGGEQLSASDHAQAYTCPYCGRLGLSEPGLHDHVASEHGEVGYGVVCPVCASQPGGDPSAGQAAGSSQFLLHRQLEEARTEEEVSAVNTQRAERAMFVQELVLNTLALSLDHLPGGGGGDAPISASAQSEGDPKPQSTEDNSEQPHGSDEAAGKSDTGGGGGNVANDGCSTEQQLQDVGGSIQEQPVLESSRPEAGVTRRSPRAPATPSPASTPPPAPIPVSAAPVPQRDANSSTTAEQQRQPLQVNGPRQRTTPPPPGSHDLQLGGDDVGGGGEVLERSVRASAGPQVVTSSSQPVTLHR